MSVRNQWNLGEVLTDFSSIFNSWSSIIFRDALIGFRSQCLILNWIFNVQLFEKTCLRLDTAQLNIDQSLK